MKEQIEISSESDLSVGVEKGRAEIVASYEGKLGGAKIVLHADAADLVDKLTDAIPGEWDDRILDSLAEKLLSKKNKKL